MSQTERTLDWIPNWDQKNNLFLVSAFDCFTTGGHRANILRKKFVWLDQGREGACTGFGTTHVLASTPNSRPGVTYDTAIGIYQEAKRQDEWPGEDYDGSSVNGAMKAARLKGYITEWHWCKTLAEIQHALSYHGSVVIGVNWYEDMFEPDVNKTVHIGGALAGGHALMLAGYQSYNGARRYRLENSWGKTWGDNGGCWISESDLMRLLDENGEFSVPKKVRVS